MAVRISGSVNFTDSTDTPSVGGSTVFIYEAATLRKVGTATVKASATFLSSELVRSNGTELTKDDRVYAVLVATQVSALTSAFYPIVPTDSSVSAINLANIRLEQTIFTVPNTTTETKQSVLSLTGITLRIPVAENTSSENAASTLSLTAIRLETPTINNTSVDNGTMGLSLSSISLVDMSIKNSSTEGSQASLSLAAINIV